MNRIPKYLYHYYELEKGPFRNITTLKYSDAQNILKNINVGFNKHRGPGYLDLRLGLEVKLKRDFIRKGGRPIRNDPFYFVLGECKWLKTWYEKTGVVRIPLKIFEDRKEIVSITYPDSMISYQLAEDDNFKEQRKPSNGQVFTLDELEELVKSYGLPSEDKWRNDEKFKFDRYIEVQVWDFPPIQNYLERL